MRTSLVIPAYNEERRLPGFLKELAVWHRAHAGALTEVLVVDDGSTDRTASLADLFAGLLPLRVIRLPRNRGKGAAVREGVYAARGDRILFMDADGATPPGELPKLLSALERAPLAVGNRWIEGSRVEGRTRFRTFSGWIYRTLTGLFGLRELDTMCGFKGFQREAARALFATLHDERWLFDAEIMLRAKKRGYAIRSVPIAWTSKRGSKLRPATLVCCFFWLPFLAHRVAREASGVARPAFSSERPHSATAKPGAGAAV